MLLSDQICYLLLADVVTQTLKQHFVHHISEPLLTIFRIGAGSGLRNEDDEEDILALLGGESIEEGADGAAYVLLVVAGDCGDVKCLTPLTKVSANVSPTKESAEAFVPKRGLATNVVLP